MTAKKKLWLALAVLCAAACLLISYSVISFRNSPHLESAHAVDETTGSPKTQPLPNPPVIAIPDTTIILKRELQFKDEDGNTALVLPVGETLVTESTQGLEYIVAREGRSFRVHCDDAFEPHGRFSNGRVEHLALQMAQEIRAEGKVPTNERIVTRATQALEDRKLDGDPADVQKQVDSLQRVLLLHP
jgi:hypothetical protein